MDGIRFDSLAKTVASARTSRQGLLRLALGAGVAMAVPGRAAAQPVEAEKSCRPDGSPCIPQGTGDCCSGKCRRIGGGVGRCRATRAAAGCTVRDNSCAPRSADGGVPCPNDASGRCFILDNGRPFCGRAATCFDCRSNAQCNRRFNRKRGRCIRCNNCRRTGRRACVFGRRS
jgi:hypothetical protein